MSQRKSLSQQLISLLSGKPKEESVDRPVPEKVNYTKEEKKTLALIQTQSLSCKDLNLEGKALTVMVTEIGQLTKLTTLNLSNNKIMSLPTTIGFLSNLELIDISNNSLVDLPKEVSNLTKLDTLIANNNLFQKIPDELWKLPLLTTVYLNDNKIQTLSKGVGNLKTLVSLNLKNNKITKIPKEIILLEDLKTLQLDGNDIQDAPVEILSLKLDIKAKLGKLLKNQVITIKSNLEGDDALILKGMDLRSLDFDTPERTKDIKKLDLTQNLLCSLHPEIFSFSQLHTLILRKNNLLMLKGISKLVNLTHLDISSNLLDEFPREIFEIPTITTLFIEKNPFLHPLPQLALKLDEASQAQWTNWDKRVKRRQVLEELITTEQDYVANVRKMCDYFTPLEKLSILSKDDLKFLFSPFQVIIGVNENFLKSLSKVYNEHNMHDSFDLGQLFVEHGFSFKLYTVYINEYMNVYNKFKSEMEKNKKFKEYWQKFPEFANKSDITKALSSYFIMPIQRMPRYQLLLNELRKNTPPEHPSTESLKKGLRVIQEIADYCNLKKAEKEFMNRVGDIAQEVNDPSLIKPSRIVLYELANVKKIEDGKSNKKAKIYLFNDLFLIIESDKVYKLENHFMAMDKIKDSFNRLRIYSNGYDAVFELENLTTLEELHQLWFEEAQRFWQAYFTQQTITESVDTEQTSRVKNITNKRISLRASSISSLSASMRVVTEKSPDTGSGSALSVANTGNSYNLTHIQSSSPKLEPLDKILSQSVLSKKISKLKGLSVDKNESGNDNSDESKAPTPRSVTPNRLED